MEAQLEMFQGIITEEIEECFPMRPVARHSTDKPWVTDGFKNLVQEIQRARLSGNTEKAKQLRNKINKMAPKLREQFYKKRVHSRQSLGQNRGRDWWKKIKSMMGLGGY